MIESMYLNKDGLRECFYQMLLKWRLRSPENCNFAYLLKTFRGYFKDDIKFTSLIRSLTARIRGDAVKLEEAKFRFYVDKYAISNNLKEKLMDFQFNEKHLWNASNYIFQEWKVLGRYLSLSENDIYLIESKYFLKEGTRECCYQVLLKWREFNPEECNLNYLCKKLIQLNLNLFVCQLIEYFSKII
jgi:hypothetical protein